MEINIQSIGERIKSRRLELNLTQTDIFNKCGIASGVLSRIENGLNVPSVLTFYKLSQTLSCSMDWLATGISTNMQNAISFPPLHDFENLSLADQQEIIELIEFKLQRANKNTGVIDKSSTSTLTVGNDNTAV